MRFLTKREVCNLLSDTASGFDVILFFMCVVIIDKKIFLVPFGVFFCLCLCFCYFFCFAKITDMWDIRWSIKGSGFYSVQRLLQSVADTSLYTLDR
jgi:hypothetical protein